MGFFKNLFAGKQTNPENEKQKNFEIFKYDGMRAQRMGRLDYAVKCFSEALNLQEDFETMGYLAQVYTQTNEHDKARSLLERMVTLEPSHVPTLLTLANLCFAMEDYPKMKEAAQRAIEVEAGNAAAHFLLGRAVQGDGDPIMGIAHLTKAISLQDDFTEARLLRAESLLHMRQYSEMAEDIEALLAQNQEEESALLLRGRLHEATGKIAEAEADYRTVTELNPFNEQGFLHLGKLYIERKQYTEAITVLDEAIELNPDSTQAYHERGRAKLLNGDKDGSLADMTKALELNPEDTKKMTGTFDNNGTQSNPLSGIL